MAFSNYGMAVFLRHCPVPLPTRSPRPSPLVVSNAMDPRAQILEAHALGRALTEGGIEHVRGQALIQVRRSMGMTRLPPPPCLDPAVANFAPHSVVRRIHGDLPSMLIGGLSALLFQMLHPLAMAGVAQHSNYRQDPLGRLERTATFLGTTTFGTVDEASAAIERVRRVHVQVKGVASDGRSYSATDPDLLTWVHVAEVSSFLEASRVYAPVTPTRQEADEYLSQMAKVGGACLGRPPNSRPTSPTFALGSDSRTRHAPPVISCSGGWAGGPTRSPPTVYWSGLPKASCPAGPGANCGSRQSQPATSSPFARRPVCWVWPSAGWWPRRQQPTVQRCHRRRRQL
jgi:hypothetical protein